MLTSSVKDYMLHHRLIWEEDLYSELEYEVGEFEKRVLFIGNRKIQSIRQFQSVMIRFLFLNNGVDYEVFEDWVMFVNDYESGSVVNAFNNELLQSDCIRLYESYINNNLTPRWLNRKIIFSKGVSRSRKCQIIGMEFSKGKKFNDTVILETFEELSVNNDVITLKDIAKHLGCTQATLSRNVSDNTKEKISNYNKTVREEKDYLSLINNAKALISEIGIDKFNLTVRLLRSISSVRNKDVTNRALLHLERFYNINPKSRINE